MDDQEALEMKEFMGFLSAYVKEKDPLHRVVVGGCSSLILEIAFKYKMKKLSFMTHMSEYWDLYRDSGR